MNCYYYNTSKPFRNELNEGGGISIREKSFYQAADIVEVLGVSQAYAYKLIRQLNEELQDKGFVTIRGRVSRKYFEERIYGTRNEEREVS